MVDENGQIVFLSETYAGRFHDKRIADEMNYQLPEGSILCQDTGFQGFIMPGVTILQPKKKPRNRKLTTEEKAENQWISRIRVLVEQCIAGVKAYRIVHDVIRHCSSDIRDQVMEICCALHNLRFQRQMLNTPISEL